MYFTIFIILSLLRITTTSSNPNHKEFKFSNTIKLDKTLEIDPTGAVSDSSPPTTGQRTGQLFYAKPLHFKNHTTTSSSFSTSLIFSINSPFPFLPYDEILFFISPLKTLAELTFSGAAPLLKLTNVLSVWLGMDVADSSYKPTNTHLAIYFNDTKLVTKFPLELQRLKPTSGDPIRVWIEYDGSKKELNVWVSPWNLPKPSRPLVSVVQDLTPLLLEKMYFGISTSNEASLSSHYVLGWSFKMDGAAPELDGSGVVEFNPLEEDFDDFRGLESVQIVCFFYGNVRNYTLNSSVVNKALNQRSLKNRGWVA